MTRKFAPVDSKFSHNVEMQIANALETDNFALVGFLIFQVVGVFPIVSDEGKVITFQTPDGEIVEMVKTVNLWKIHKSREAKSMFSRFGYNDKDKALICRCPFCGNEVILTDKRQLPVHWNNETRKACIPPTEDPNR